MLFSGLFVTILASSLICSRSLETLSTQIKQLSNINSGSLNEAGLERAASWIKSELTALGIPAQWSLPTRSLTATRGSNDAAHKILLVGHLDTVFEEFHPFQTVQTLSKDHPASRLAHRYGPVISGPGVADAKGGIILMLEFLRQAHEMVNQGQIQFKIFIAGDEEIGSKFSKAAMLRFAEGVDLALVFEPGWYDTDVKRHRIPARMGGNSHWTLTLQTTESHAGVASKAPRVSILESLARLNRDLQNLSPETIMVNVFEIDAQSKPNVSLGSVNLKIATRFESLRDEARLKTFLQQSESRLRRQNIRLTFHELSLWRPHDITSADLVRLWQTAHQKAGLPKPLSSLSLARSAASFLAAAKIPVVDSLGPYGKGYHSDQEVVWLGSFDERLSALQQLVRLVVAKEMRP